MKRVQSRLGALRELIGLVPANFNVDTKFVAIWDVHRLTSVKSATEKWLTAPNWKKVRTRFERQQVNDVLCQLLFFSDWFYGFNNDVFFLCLKISMWYFSTELFSMEGVGGVLMNFLSSCHCSWHFDFMPDLLTDHNITTMKTRTFEVHARFSYSPFPTLLPTAEIIVTSANTLHCLSSLFQKLTTIKTSAGMNLLYKKRCMHPHAGPDLFEYICLK